MGKQTSNDNFPHNIQNFNTFQYEIQNQNKFIRQIPSLPDFSNNCNHQGYSQAPEQLIQNNDNINGIPQDLNLNLSYNTVTHPKDQQPFQVSANQILQHQQRMNNNNFGNNTNGQFVHQFVQ